MVSGAGAPNRFSSLITVTSFEFSSDNALSRIYLPTLELNDTFCSDVSLGNVPLITAGPQFVVSFET